MRVGSKVEALEEGVWCVGTVTAVKGAAPTCQIRVHFDGARPPGAVPSRCLCMVQSAVNAHYGAGWKSCFDQWLTVDQLAPPGWCAAAGKELTPPKRWRPGTPFSWQGGWRPASRTAATEAVPVRVAYAGREALAPWSAFPRRGWHRKRDVLHRFPLPPHCAAHRPTTPRAGGRRRSWVRVGRV